METIALVFRQSGRERAAVHGEDVAGDPAGGLGGQMACGATSASGLPMRPRGTRRMLRRSWPGSRWIRSPIVLSNHEGAMALTRTLSV